MKRTIHSSWNQTFTADEAEKRFNLCVKKIDELLGLNQPNIKKMMEKASSRTYEEYILTLRLIESAKHYLKFFNRNKTDELYLLYSKDLDLYKIGITCDIEQRIKSIKYEMGIKELDVIFLIPKMAYKEKELHEKFKNDNVIVKRKLNHREWFSFNNEIINEFEILKNG